MDYSFKAAFKYKKVKTLHFLISQNTDQITPSLHHSLHVVDRKKISKSRESLAVDKGIKKSVI